MKVWLGAENPAGTIYKYRVDATVVFTSSYTSSLSSTPPLQHPLRKSKLTLFQAVTLPVFK
jgi:hypothetical protein